MTSERAQRHPAAGEGGGEEGMVTEMITGDEMPMSAEEEAEFVLYDSMLRRGWQDVGMALTQIRAKRLYRKKWRTFEAYCGESLGMTTQRAYLLIQAVEITRNLIETSTIVDVLPTNEAQARPLAQVPPAEQSAVWQRATEIAAERGESVVARHVTEAVQERSGGGGERSVPAGKASNTATTRVAGSGNDAPLTDAELVDLSRLGGWEVQAERTSPHGLPLITMAVMRGEHWGETHEERTPGGWRIERDALRAKEEATAPAAAPAAPAPPPAAANPLTAVADALRRGDTPAAYAAARAAGQASGRAFAAIDARVDGRPIEEALALLDAPVPAPALSAFPPGHVEGGIGAVERRLKGQIAEPSDQTWARTLRPQLDAAREGMQPAVYQAWSNRLDVATESLIRLFPADQIVTGDGEDDSPDTIEIEDNDEGMPRMVAEGIAQIAEALRLLARGEAHAVDTSLLGELARALIATPTPARGTLQAVMTRIVADAEALAATGHITGAPPTDGIHRREGDAKGA
jgi:hypothetical protein